LLLVLAHLAGSTTPRAPVRAVRQVISVRDLIMIGGGIFLLVKGDGIHDAIYKRSAEASPTSGRPRASSS